MSLSWTPFVDTPYPDGTVLTESFEDGKSGDMAYRNWTFLDLDDITFPPHPDMGKIGFIGYDVYRNGEKINAEPLAEGSFFDANAPEAWCFLLCFVPASKMSVNIR